MIVNRTQGAAVPASMDVMLHGWIEDQERIMLHGKSDPDGSFHFNGVDFEAGINLSAMASYNDVVYFSEAAQVDLSGKIEAGPLGLFKANDSRIEIAIGSGVLGLALSGVGIWWWRKSGNTTTEEEYAEEVDETEEDEPS